MKEQKINNSYLQENVPFHIPEESYQDDPALGDNEGRLALDIFDTEETLFIVAPMAGVDANEVEITISEDVLTVRGKRVFPEKLPQAKNFYTEECFWGAFSRSIVLPSAVNSADIKAKMKKNILVIAIPKAKKVKSKKILVEES